MARERESVEEKGRRLFSEGRVSSRDGGYRGVWVVRGENGSYRVRDGRCECPARSRCSHEVAADLAERAVLAELPGGAAC
jgi:predicted nucleic acid-binding Zn finger protein